MKTALISLLVATASFLAIAITPSTVSAQQASSAGGKGETSSSSDRGGDRGADRGGPAGSGGGVLNAAVATHGKCLAGASCTPPTRKPRKIKVIESSDNCGCNVKVFHVGGRTTVVKDCYNEDLNTNLPRLCEPDKQKFLR